MNKAVLFPGQGSQHLHMGEELYHSSTKAKSILDSAEAIVPGLLAVCFGDDQSALNQTEFAQPAIVAVSAALWDNIPGVMRNGYVTGHSLGEYSALYASGVLGLPEVLQLVQYRAQLMAKAAQKAQGGMVAVMGLSFLVVLEMISELGLQDQLFPANRNSDLQTVLSGLDEAISQFSAVVVARGGKAVRLGVSGPFHSPLIREAAEEFAEILKGYPLAKPDIPYVSATTASQLSSPDEIKTALIQQFTSPVLWTDTIAWLAKSGVNTVVEVGPGKVLTGLVKRIDSGIRRINVSTLEDIKSLQPAND